MEDVQMDIPRKQTDKSRIRVFCTGAFIVKPFQLLYGFGNTSEAAEKDFCCLG